jgi:carboxylate-amine ligase
MIEHRYGLAGTAPTLGAELELFTVDRSSGHLVETGARSLIAAAPPALNKRLKLEFNTGQIELLSGVHHTAGALEADLRGMIDALRPACIAHGIALLGTGTHPIADWQDHPVERSIPRYAALAETLGHNPALTPISGLHIHVGCPSPEAAVRACDRLRRDVPILIALAANSPYWCGADTQFASYRTELTALFGVSGLPPHFGSWAGYAGLIEEMQSSGVLAPGAKPAWDVRPHPAHGTIEVRAFDMPNDLETVAALAALCQCLVTRAMAIEAVPWPLPGDEARLRTNRWRAARFGMAALLAVPDGQRPLVSLADLLIDQIEEQAPTLGCTDELARCRTLVHAPGGVARQRLARSGPAGLAGTAARLAF